jgi:cytochrome c553
MPSAHAGVHESWPRPAVLPLILLVLLIFPFCALAQDPALSGQRLAATCANCHGTLGNPADSSFAPLAGMPPLP